MIPAKELKKKKIDSELYIEVLKEGLLPMYDRLRLKKKQWLFQ